MLVDHFDFELPQSNIALRPAKPRDSARLLVVNEDGMLVDSGVLELPSYLRAGDALVFNDTKVIPAQLAGIRNRDGIVAKVSTTLHMRLGLDRWAAFMKPAKKVLVGDIISFSNGRDVLTAKIADKKDGGEVVLQFDCAGEALDGLIAQIGSMPLPPYIASQRAQDMQDQSDYQTMFADKDGAVAAPTAGLHMTERLLQSLHDAGISHHTVTLHVGAGTFLPVKVDDTQNHKMHSEIGHIDADTAEALNDVKARGGRIVSVGTTSLRLLESAAGEDGVLRPYSDATDIFIEPGYRFRFVDCLMTNFHLPRSTLFMLVSAFSGLDVMQMAYAHAIKDGYRFYSYGDACLLSRRVFEDGENS